MKKIRVFYLAIILTIVGFSLIGTGIGGIVDRSCIGLIIGLGSGFITTALILFKIFRRIDAFEKNNKK
ncbi:hypothetical protein [Pedobacter sandarakinus]|uniref:hypothetical protein n=1 Tax=Pedobacter sandarakinus TaxID=353156 RepID=UPI00224617AB|nr:hypothetical protein [Pedobacter sandarakinus]MCX2573651.1 hypothetical protein [Pedobacter sandarakinus]